MFGSRSRSNRRSRLAVSLPAIAICMVAATACRRGGAPNPQRGDDAVEGAEQPVPEALGDAERAEWFIARGRYAEALPVIERVVTERRQTGSERLRLGEALMSLGMVQDSLGRSRDALSPLAEAWDIFQERGAPAATLGACADALGLACQAAGEFGDAEQALLAAIDYRQLASPDDDEPWVSASRVHLGRLYLTMARFEEAEALLGAALDSARNEVAVAARARQLGSYHHTLGGYSRAIALFERARVAARSAFGEGSFQVAAIIGDLGLAQLRAGDLEAARQHLEASYRRAAALPDAPPDLVKTAGENLATFYLFVGEAAKALPLLAEADDVVDLNNLGVAQQMTGAFDAAAESLGAARRRADSELDPHHPLRVQILQNLALLRADLGDESGTLRLAAEAGDAAVELLDHLLEFGSEAQRLDFRRISDPLSLLCSSGAPAEEIADMLRRTKGVVLDSLITAATPDRETGGGRRPVPEGGALVDYALYQQYLGKGSWEQRYGALVRRDGAPPRWVTLGTAKRLRSLLSDLQAHMAAAGGGDRSEPVLALPAVLQGLYDYCVRPLGDCGESLVVAPDGDLSFVPFAALLDGEAFLCEQVGRLDLVPSSRAGHWSPHERPGGWAFCAVRDYGGELPDGAGGELRQRLASLGDLPGVATEREALSEIAPFRALPSDKGELIETLRKGGAPRVLHFSCHGLFLGGGERPMFRSGLVLAGREVLFAGEIASLPLAGTELVTLSACDTGLGVGVAGEGVLGLQRGFQLAGANHILMTLWAVGDRELPNLMSEFYQRAAAGEDPPRALWLTQRGRLVGRSAGEALASAVWSAGALTILSAGAG